MANISNSKSNTLITGTDSADWIYNSGNSVTIAAKGGNDTVKSTGEYVSINAGEGKDTIIFDDSELAGTQYHAWVSVAGGNNYIKNPVELSTIVTGDGADTIIAGGGTGNNGRFDGYGNSVDYSDKYASIMAGAGNNQITVNSYMKEGKISVQGGNDTLLTSGIDNSTINVGNGKNFVTIGGSGSNNIITAGNGDDYISLNSSSTNNQISVGSGNNTVNGAGTGESVYAGGGNNRISVGGGYVEVGDGKNKVSALNSGYVSVVAGTGDDTIIMSEKSTGTEYHNFINVTGGNNYINNNAELSTIIAGSGNDTIITGGGIAENDWGDAYGNSDSYAAHYTSIMAGAGNNRITVNSYMKEGSITAGDGNDVISIASAENSSINIGSGRNTLIAVNVLHIKGNTFLAGNGSDLVRMSGSDNLIGVGSGRNRVSLTGGQNNTIISGAGNDTISLASSANNNAIVFGGGSDIVYNYHASDTILTAEEITQRTVGNDIILVDGTNKMTLKGAKGKTVNIATLASNRVCWQNRTNKKT